jgi:peroxiredoxin Q/BCP
MTAPALDEIVEFTAQLTGGKQLRLSELRGSKIALFFYPKANTPGCTQESQDFRDLHEEFSRKGVVVLGASRDGLKAQENFKTRHELPFELISDPDEAICRLFGVIKEKNMYGRKVLGIERSTFLIDARGVLRRAWRGVKVKGHAAEVLAAADEI